MPPKHRQQSATVSEPKRTRTASSGRTKTQIVATKPASPFFALPREIRDQIYHEIWRMKPPFEVALSHKGNYHNNPKEYVHLRDYHVFRITYENLEIIPGLLLEEQLGSCETSSLEELLDSAKLQPNRSTSPWILASRQVLEEAMEQFNRQMSWTYVNYSTGRTNTPTLAWRSPRAKRANRQRKDPQLLAVENACHLILATQLTLNTLGEMDAKENAISRVMFDQKATELLHVLGQGTVGSKSLKRLHLEFEACGPWCGEQLDDPIEVDLRHMESLDLPNLQALVVTVRFKESFRNDARLMSKLGEEISQKCKALVGDEGKETCGISFAPDFQWNFTFTSR
ncbi:hypothetical protein EJ02DRAFT_511483 [Clathrospora elynae]|uniref:Uncharacterized protein n=1 Tax=Clathrospora elynae TaxID=706981 RepID=A0A6A5T0M8_9PLEO|nr:hypothetical protein EJ02DRAFT_511483 [Clathrospora elynae]